MREIRQIESRKNVSIALFTCMYIVHLPYIHVEMNGFTVHHDIVLNIHFLNT